MDFYSSCIQSLPPPVLSFQRQSASNSISGSNVAMASSNGIIIIALLLLALTTGDGAPLGRIQCNPRRSVPVSNSSEMPPDCKYYVRDPSVILKTTCLENGVLRVVGDYNVFHINCTAPYPLDFNFDGIRPTEAIMVDSRRIVNRSAENPEEYLYEVNLSVYSIPALRAYYEDVLNTSLNISSSKKYSRTGEYNLSGFFNRANISTRMYIFFEEPDATYDFIRNEKLIVSSSNDQLIVPCRPTHYAANVSIQKNGGQMTWDFNPQLGFILQNETFSSNYSYFTCTLKHGLTTSSMELDSFGEMNEYKKRIHSDNEAKMTPHPIELPIFNFGSYRLNIKCHFKNLDSEKNTTILSTIGTTTPTLYKLLHAFVWPEYFNRSYSVIVVGNQRNGNWNHDLSVDQDGYLVQSAFCGNEHKNTSSSISILVSGHPNTFGFDEDWSLLDRNRNNTSTWFLPAKVKDGAAIYQNEIIEFRMRASNFIFIPPCIWHVEYKNGSTLLEHVNEDWNDGLCTFRKKVTTDMQNVYCSASMWLKNEWWNSSMGPSLNIHECIPPRFEATEQTLVQVSMGSTLLLKCTANGTPVPNVSWLRDNVTIKNGSLGSSTYDYSKVQQDQEGEYICVASNCHGTERKVFTVHVSKEGGIYVVIFIITAMLLTISWILCSVYIRYLKTRTGRLTPSELDTFYKGDLAATYTPGKLYICPSAMPYEKRLEVERARFQIDETRVLGTGEYGIVYFGLLDSKPVAIKTVKDKYNTMQTKSLMAELKTLQCIEDHDNLIHLHGAHTAALSHGKMFIILEYCPLDSLEKFLRSEEANYGIKFTLRDMYLWAVEIANGMAHLGSKTLVHGDLAARNVLLTADKQAKITDFGHSRKLYTSVEYVIKDESDVWSYGVTLWEIFSLAQVPFQDCRFGPQFVEQIKNGQRLEKPFLASDDLYNQIMVECWNEEPSQRPTFKALNTQLTCLMTGTPGYTSIAVTSNERIQQPG